MIPTQWVFVHELPYTASGKVDRPKLLEILKDPPVFEFNKTLSAPEGSPMQQLHDIWCQVLGVASINEDDNFFELGGDSILAISVASRAKQAGIQISGTDLFKSPTLSGLTPSSFSTSSPNIDEMNPIGEFPLTPIHRYFVELDLQNPDFWHQNLLLEIPYSVSYDHIVDSITALHEAHPSLRLTMDYHSGSARIASKIETETEVRLLAVANQDESSLRATIEAEANFLGASISLNKPSLLKATLFEGTDNEPKKLLIVAHHLLVDAVSWQIIIQDLDTLLSPPFRIAETSLSPPTTSFRQWASQLKERVDDGAFKKDLAFWTNQPYPIGNPFKKDSSNQTCFIENEIDVSTITIEPDLIKKIKERLRSETIDFQSLLTSAFVFALVRTTRPPTHTIWMEGHGREDLVPGADLSRTLGWFTSLFPVVIESSTIAEIDETIREVKATLAEIPNRGVTYGLLRYLEDDDTRQTLTAISGYPSIIFNYLGQTKIAEAEHKGIRTIDESVGRVRAPENTQKAILETNASLEGEQLVIHFNYNQTIITDEMMDQLIKSFEYFVREWVTLDDTNSTPGQFATSGLDIDDLETLFN